MNRFGENFVATEPDMEQHLVISPMGNESKCHETGSVSGRRERSDLAATISKPAGDE